MTGGVLTGRGEATMNQTRCPPALQRGAPSHALQTSHCPENRPVSPPGSRGPSLAHTVLSSGRCLRSHQGEPVRPHRWAEVPGTSPDPSTHPARHLLAANHVQQSRSRSLECPPRGWFFATKASVDSFWSHVALDGYWGLTATGRAHSPLSNPRRLAT